MKRIETFKKIRNEIQEDCSNIFSNLQTREIFLLESPTGSGKTYIDALSAVKYKKKHGGSVIISTNTNKNVNEIVKTLRKESERFGIDKSCVVTEIGRSNYIDINRLYLTVQENPDLYKGITAKSLENNYLKSTSPLTFQNNILMDDFLKEYDYDASEFGKFSAFLQDDTKTISPKTLSHIEELLASDKIIVTNHAYLIILFRYYGNHKNISIKEEYRNMLFSAPIIMDEFHTLYNAAKAIFTNCFSLFRLKYSVTALLNLEASTLTKTTNKKLRIILSKIIDIEKIASIKESELQSLLATFKIELGGASKLHALATSIKKGTMKTPEGEKYARFVITELVELAVINLHKTIGVRVELSPRGYPSIEVSNGIPSYELRNIFWLRHAGPFMGLSGTLRTASGDDIDAYRWIMERTGLFIVDKESTQEVLSKNKELSEEAKESIIYNGELLNQSIMNIKRKKISSFFDRSNYIYTVPQHSSLKIPMLRNDKEQYEKDKEVWRKNIGIFISNTLRYSSLVLVVGYEDARTIGEFISKYRKDIAVHYAKEGISINHTVDEYIKDIESGKVACLIGTDQYYTGLDLPGKYLEEFYMCKIPFQNPSGNTGKKVYKYLSFSKSESYQNETLLKFLQGKGRPIRDFSDKAILYLLDDRILDQRRQRYKFFLDEVAIKQDYESILRIRDSFLRGKSQGEYSNIYALFYPVFQIELIEEILKKLKISEREVKEINKACKILLQSKITCHEYDIEKILESKKYDIWNFLLKMAINAYKKDGGDKNIENIIIENQLFEYDNTIEFSKEIFKGVKIKEISDFIEFLAIF